MRGAPKYTLLSYIKQISSNKKLRIGSKWLPKFVFSKGSVKVKDSQETSESEKTEAQSFAWAWKSNCIREAFYSLGFHCEALYAPNPISWKAPTSYTFSILLPEPVSPWGCLCTSIHTSFPFFILLFQPFSLFIQK